MIVAGAHDTSLVGLSIMIAAVASYTALDLATRAKASRAGARHAWLAAAAAAMGGGIWSMHFVGMLAFSMPGMTAHYDIKLTLLSLALPILATGAGFVAARREGAGHSTLLLSGLLMGLGVVAMHYVGMAAMQMPATLSHDPLWAAASVAIAIGASTVALWLAFRRTGLTQRVTASLAMGVAVSGMHYAAMQGAVFAPHEMSGHGSGDASFGQTNLALAVSATTFLILFLALVAAMFDRRFAILAEREAVALRASEERFRALYRRTPLPLHSCDESGRVENVSDAWLDLLGYTREEVIGRPITDFMTDDAVRQRRDEVWPRLLREGALDAVEYRLRTKSGATRDTLFSGRVEQDAQGHKHVFGGVVDITDRKRAEAAAEKALGEAQQADRAKTEFLASMSHEIRTPLNSILGFTNLLLGASEEGSDTRRKLELIKNSGTLLLTIVNDVLDFSRIEAGQVELDPGTFALPGLVDGVVSMLAGVVHGRPLRVGSHLDPSLPPLLVGDANRLQQILLNLMNNAVKFTSEGEVVLSVVDDGRDGDRVRLRFEVTDTGIGIPKEKIGDLFERFRQVDSSITRRYGGSGLGLAISRQLVGLMGGDIGVESVEGTGSTFWVRLALPVGRAADLERIESPARAAVSEAPARVLLVEDLEINQELARLFLEAAGHNVDLAADGAEAVAAVQRRSYDVVLMDIQMPGMDGISATQHIRSLEGPARTVPIVAMTANVLPQQVAGFMRAGMNDHVGKPFKAGELLGAVARWKSRGASGAGILLSGEVPGARAATCETSSH